MKHLLYCIFRRDTTMPAGGRSEVSIIEGTMLAAAASPWGDRGGIDLDSLRRFAQVVAAFHTSRTIIPLRYGCTLADRSQVVDLLEQNQEDYRKLLDELEGRVEMGLRLLRQPVTDEAPHTSDGRRYLDLARKRQGGLTAGESRWTDGLIGQLSGLYVQEKREARATPGGRLVSLYFLVPRGEVGNFQDHVRQLTVAPDVKLLASGPWPPYNFTDHVRT